MGDCGGDGGGYGGGGRFGVGFVSPSSRSRTTLSQHPCAIVAFFTAFLLLVPLGLFTFLVVRFKFSVIWAIATGVCACLVLLLFGLGCYCCRRRPRNARHQTRQPAVQTNTVLHQNTHPSSRGHTFQWAQNLPSLTTPTNGLSANTPSGTTPSDLQVCTQPPSWTRSPIRTMPDLDPPPSYSEAMKMDTVKL